LKKQDCYLHFSIAISEKSSQQYVGQHQ